MSYPIQRHFLESLEAVFLTQARFLLKEIAQDLGKPEKPLLKAFEQSKVKLHVIDTHEEAQEGCKGLVPVGTLAKRCREPVYHGTCYCPLHLRFPSKEPESIDSVRRLKTEDGEEYFVNANKESVYSKDSFQLCGTVKNGKFTVFKVENDSKE